MPNYAQHVNRRSTPQTKPVLGKHMVKNDGGGYSFAVDCWTRLNRFLVMGCEGGHFQVGEAKLTQENAKAVYDCVAADPQRTVTTILEVSEGGRAAKNDSAIFALALMASATGRSGQLALAALPRVCRIPTHLFQFIGFCKSLRGWGRGLRSAVAKWYLDKPLSHLALQVTKYPNREGYTHRDALRLAHPQTIDVERNRLFAYCVGRVDESTGLPEGMPTRRAKAWSEGQLAYIAGFEAAKRATTEHQIIQLIDKFGLVREHLPTGYLNSAAVWEALLKDMPPTAMIRNLAKMTSVGLIAPLSDASQLVAKKLADTEAMKKAKVHPFALLLAQTTYAAGKGVKGELTWRPVPQVLDAVECAFYAAFDLVEPTNKRHYLAIDVSGSMSWESSRIANTHIHAREGAACMAMVTLRTEPNSYAMAFSNSMYDLGLSKSMRLDQVVRRCEEAPAGGTNCAAPILDAMHRKIPVDVFVVYTDNDTNSAQTEHPFQALEHYRQRMGINAKMAVVAMAPNLHSIANVIADDGDAGMLDIVGFDSEAPSILAEFVR